MAELCSAVFLAKRTVGGGMDGAAGKTKERICCLPEVTEFIRVTGKAEEHGYDDNG